MTKFFKDMKTDNVEKSGDRLGGSFTLDTGVYKAKVKLAYIGKAQNSDSTSVNIHLDIDGREYRFQEWVTNRKGENFFVDKKTKKEVLLPGYQTIDDLCLLTTANELSEQDSEEKVVNLWDFESRAEVPQNVPVLVDLLDQEITVAIVRQIVDKNTKQDDGSYKPSGETREENVVEKYFHSESLRTTTEIRAEIEEGIFIEKWAEINNGKPPRNKSTGAAGNSGRPGARPSAASKPASAGAAANTGRKNLFAS